jgi:hypothetical protein
MTTIQTQDSFEIIGIFIIPANDIIGIPMFRQNDQEFREYNKFIELWQKNEDGRLSLQKRWRKTSIAYIEYADMPNFWVEPRSIQNK